MLKKRFIKIVGYALAVGLISNSVQASLIHDRQAIDKSLIVYDTELSGGVKADLSLADESKIIEMLKSEGKLGKNASFEESNKAIKEYLNNIEKKSNKDLNKVQRALEARKKEHKKNENVTNIKGDGKVTEVNVLAVAIEFNDYKHNMIKEGQTELYYSNYDKKHYQDMLFGAKGYVGPNGEKLLSMKQYYEQQSGGTFKINGTVTDWHVSANDAAFYGGATAYDYDANPKMLVAEALNSAAQDSSIDLSQFDKMDRYDLDGDGNYNEPDGIIDYLMVIHAGLGQENGGGDLGEDAIWSQRSNLGGLYPIGDTGYYAFDYTLEPEDGTVGVFAHEFGHDLGLVDEYDTAYTSAIGEPISYWSLMSSGNYSGKITGTEPTGISPYGRQLLQSIYGGNWQNQRVVNYSTLNSKGISLDLKAASKNGEAIKVNLPDVASTINTPTSGNYSYYGGKGHDGAPLLTFMTKELDLKDKVNPILNLKAWYDIEEGWDFASVQVREKGWSEWTSLEGSITTTERNPEAVVYVENGITGNSNGWVDGTFNLEQFAGKNIEIKVQYEADPYNHGQGIYIDDINVTDNNTVIFNDDVEKEGIFTLSGFERNTGIKYAKNYYLIEWRNHTGVDAGLANVNTFGSMIAYDPGMVVWYVNDLYSDNWTGQHPGKGFLSVVDADQNNVSYLLNDNSTMNASSKYQMHDAAFSKNGGSKFILDFSKTYGLKVVDKYATPNVKFMDKQDYTNTLLPQVGVELPKLGLELQVFNQSKDNSSATIKVSKK